MFHLSSVRDSQQACYHETGQINPLGTGPDFDKMLKTNKQIHVDIFVTLFTLFIALLEAFEIMAQKNSCHWDVSVWFISDLKQEKRGKCHQKTKKEGRKNQYKAKMIETLYSIWEYRKTLLRAIWASCNTQGIDTGVAETLSLKRPTFIWGNKCLQRWSSLRYSG